MPQQSTDDVRFRFDLTETSEDKRATRAAVRAPLCSEIVGADMRTQGGVRVFPGFKRYLTLGEDGRAPANAADQDLLAPDGTTVSGTGITRVIDFMPVSVRIGAKNIGDGFVVRYETTPGDVTVALQIYDPVGFEVNDGSWGGTLGGKWRWIEIATVGGALEWDDVAMRGEDNFDVAVFGRLIYFFLRGAEPRLWYVDVDEDSDGTETAYWSELVTNTGPGERPMAPEVEVKSRTHESGVLNGSKINPYQSPRFSVLDSDGETSIYTEPDEPLTLDNITNDSSEGQDITGNPPLADLDWDELDKFRPGRYSFAYQLEDKKTKRVSQLSELTTIETDDFERYVATTAIPVFRSQDFTLSDDSEINENVIVRYERQFSAAPVRGYMRLRIPQIDTSRWNRVRVYRSIRVEAGGVQGSGQTLFLDSVWDLPDSQLTGGEVTFPASGSLGDPNSGFDPNDYEGPDRAEWLTDLALSVQERYNNRAQFLKDMPFGGVAEVYRNTLFVAQSASSAQTAESIRGVGETRWSSLSETSPELFPPDNLFIPTNAKDEINRFFLVGDALIGVSEARMYPALKSASSVTLREQHEGYGAANYYAGAPIGSSLFLVTKSGLVQVGVDGELQHVTRLDHLLINEWAGDLDDVSMAYDSKSGVLFILNPTKEECACLWQTSRSLSELEHMNFRLCAPGRMAFNTFSNDDYQRAFFVRDNGAVYVLNDDRAIMAGGEATVRTLETGLDVSVLTISAVVDSNTLTFSGATSVTTNSLLGDDIEGVKVCFIDGDKAGQVVETSNFVSFAANLLTLDFAGSPGFVAGDVGAKVAVSPVPFRVRTAPLAAPDSGTSVAYGMNLHQRKHAKSMGCLFEQLSGAQADSGVFSWTASAYVGLEPTAAATGAPRTPALIAGPGGAWAYFGTHGVSGAVIVGEVFICASDVDFRLLSTTIAGNIEDSDRHGART